MAPNDPTPPDAPLESAFGHAELEVDGLAMVRLLGPQDRLLTRLEHEFPGVEVHVRGLLFQLPLITEGTCQVAR